MFVDKTHLSNDGSLLNISVGTVAGASTIPISDCFDCKCLSTSSAVIWPSVMVSVFMTAGGCTVELFVFFCVCFLRFGAVTFLFGPEFVTLFFRLWKVYFIFHGNNGILISKNVTSIRDTLFLSKEGFLLLFFNFFD